MGASLILAVLLLLGCCKGESSDLLPAGHHALSSIPRGESSSSTVELRPCNQTSKGSLNAISALSQQQKKKNWKQSKTTIASIFSGARRQSMLRLQREWKDAVQAGIAFDWSKGKPYGNPEGASHIWIGPFGGSLSIWHFTLTGLPGSVFETGVYHGRIILPADYPTTPPRIMMLTPSGRFVPGGEICLSASQYHPETWMPSKWNLRTLVESLRLHMCTAANEIGGLNDSYEERLAYAKASQTWRRMSRSKTKVFFVDHSQMLEMGFLPRLEETKDEGKEEKGGIDLPMTQREDEMEFVQNHQITSETDVEVQIKSMLSSRLAVSSEQQLVMREIHRTFTSPFRLGLLAFFIAFCWLNL